MITIEKITEIVLDYYHIPYYVMCQKTRKREIVQARQVAMYFSRDLTIESLYTIGSYIGSKDHATVVHACKTVNNLIDTDKYFRGQIKEIKQKIQEEINEVVLIQENPVIQENDFYTDEELKRAAQHTGK